ncbi:tRNA uridine(34) 5-carboxymethylaminomethyl modification radical SAM/GNAT enzyme Elp3, partial [Candidatus Bathyarchaeota archaeon]|nr:tRNA uridine(34) 5-carboxymethylaminomethyl modification radical SAM/GNAT enzyme Elp3 [Candidatus Bathyarchaeota archaeon]
MNGDEAAIEEERFRNACRAILKEILETGLTSKRKLVRLKAKYCKKFSLSRMPKNAHIIEIASEDELQEVLPLLRRRKTRTLSGVSVIAVMTKPIPCPGLCVYCPGIDSQPGEPVAQSYTGREPAALRSIMNNYDPYQQVVSRIDDLEAI